MGEYFERFCRSSSLCPFKRVETQIVAPLGVGTRVNQELYEVCMAKNDREDKRGLTSARTLIYVHTFGN